MTNRRLLPALLLPAACLALASAPARAPERWAVIVGINDYVNFGPEDKNGDLKGAEGDARAMRQVLLERYGFPEENTRMLLNREATRAALEEAIDGWLRPRVRAGDLVVFYFAGHGSRVIDTDGDEPDGLDETICPTDVHRRSFRNDIRDDELRRWLGRLATPEVVVILDSCFSGTATRAIHQQPRRLERDLPPPVRTRGGNADGARETITDGAGGILEIASAAPDQPAMDAVFFVGDRGIETFHGGAFTTHFVRRLWQAPPNASYQEIFRATVMAMRADNFSQDPQLYGPVTRPVFQTAAAALAGAPAPVLQVPEAGLAPARPVEVEPVPPVAATAAPEPALSSAGSPPSSPAAQSGAPPSPAAAPADVADARVLSVDAAGVLISAGESRGVRAGALFGTAGGAVLRVMEARPVESLAEPVRGSAIVGERVRLLASPLPQPTLRVEAATLPAEVRARIAAAVAAVDGLELVTDAGAPADLYLRFAETGDPLRLLTGDGAIRAFFAASELADPAPLVDALRRELAFRRIAALENPASPFPVTLEFADGATEFSVGDTVALRVRSGRAGHLTLVDLAADGRLTILYPNPFAASDRIEADAEVRIPGPEFVITAGPPAGWGLVRALVTEQPLELPPGHGGLLSSDEAEWLAGELANALRRAAAADRGLQVAKAGDVSAADWASAVAVYRIRD